MSRLTLVVVVMYNGIIVESTRFAIFKDVLVQSEGDRVWPIYSVLPRCMPVHRFLQNSRIRMFFFLSFFWFWLFSVRILTNTEQSLMLHY